MGQDQLQMLSQMLMGGGMQSVQGGDRMSFGRQLAGDIVPLLIKLQMAQGMGVSGGPIGMPNSQVGSGPMGF